VRGKEEEEYIEPEIDVYIPERARLANILCYQPDGLTDDELLERRIEAVQFMVDLCDKRETVKRHRIKRTKTEPTVGSKSPDARSERRPNSDLFPLLMQVSQCPDCVGDERLSFEERTFKYSRPTVRNDHFDEQHLIEREQAQRRGEKMVCKHPTCRDLNQGHDLEFYNIDHFRAHVQEVHHITLRSSDQVHQRRLRKIRRRKMAIKQTIINGAV
ncbi:hypothetical protein F66182_9527, partial [Fusarium sp. NRRL 66182]